MFRTLNQKRRPVKRTLGIQTMERREMMAGDATEFTTRTHEPQTVPSVFQVGTPNNTLGTATYIGIVGTTVTRTGSVGGSGDPVDYWKFSTRETGTITANFRLEGMSRDLDVYILDWAGRELGRGFNGSTTNENVNINLIAGREYYAKVVPWRFSNVASNYRLTINIADNALATAENLGDLRAHPHSFAVNGTVGGNDPVDVYRFRATTPGIRSFRLSGMSQDLDLYLLDSSGNVLASSRRAGTAVDTVIYNMTPGREYHVRVVPYGHTFSDSAPWHSVPQSNYFLQVGV